MNTKTTLNFGGLLEDINDPLVMGILNVTPDSFYDGGKNISLEMSIKNVNSMVSEGMDILDIGAYSSRPGAEHISAQEELDRLLPHLHEIRNSFPKLKISVDTFRAEVAKEAIAKGADMVNDISGGDLDHKMWEVVADSHVPYVIMHMPGNPQNMQKKTNYTDVVDEVILNLSTKIKKLTQLGVVDIIVDPGFGFAKTLEQNYQLLARLRELEILGHPILVGVSRKSMIYKLLDISPDQALNGTTGAHVLALDRGARILRVHDVWAARQAITIWKSFQTGRFEPNN